MARTTKTKPTTPAKAASKLGAIKEAIGQTIQDKEPDPVMVSSKPETETAHAEEKKPSTESSKKKNDKKSSSRAGLPDGWERFTMQVRSDYVDKLKDYAYTERIPMREAADRMFAEFLDSKTDLLERPNKSSTE